MSKVLELHNSDGELVAVLEKALNATFIEEVNVAEQLTFQMPANDDKLDEITRRSEIWLRERETEELIKIFLPYQERGTRAGAAYRQVLAEGLMSQLAGEWVPFFDSSGKNLTTIITELLAFQRSDNPITVGTIEPTWQDLSGWISPTSYADPDSGWANEAYAYDNNELTMATGAAAQGGWTKELELYHAGVVGDRIKILWSKSSSEASTFMATVYVQYDGGWHLVFSDTITGGYGSTVATIEAELSATKTITGMKVKFYNGGTLGAVSFVVREGYIWGVEGGKLAVTNQTLLWSILQQHAIVGEGFISVDNSRQFNWLNDIGEDKGQQIRYGKNLVGIVREVDWGSLCTRLYPVGSGVALSDITVAKEAADKDSDASYGYLTLTSLYSCYKDWTGEGDNLPSNITVYKNDVDDSSNWEQGEDEHTLRCDIGDYDAGATYTISYRRADYLIAWDAVEEHGIISRGWQDNNVGTAGTLLERGRLELTNSKSVPVVYQVNAADLSGKEGFEFEALQLGSVVKVVDEGLGIDVPVRATKITKSNILTNDVALSMDLSAKVRNIADALADMYRQFG